MTSMRPCFLVLAAGAVLAAVVACGGGSISPPTSDNQFDDPCDPGSGSGGGTTLPPVDAGALTIAIPQGSPGIGFDDLRFSPTLDQLLVPAGRTGDLDLVDPSSEIVTPIGGFSSQATYGADDTFGVTSADEGDGTVYAVDRTSSKLSVVSARDKSIVASTALAATPGYVRYVAQTGELWVTEPSQQQIEIFTVGSNPVVAPSHAAVIGVAAAGPESLEIDATTKRAYTNAGTSTLAIDVAGRSVAATWSNGCKTSGKGIAVDAANGWVLVACNEGTLTVLDAQSGSMLGSATLGGGGADQLAYDPQSGRAYVPTPSSAALSVVTVSAGAPKVLGSVQVASDSHCAVTPGSGSVYVCAPSRGALLFVKDPF